MGSKVAANNLALAIKVRFLSFCFCTRITRCLLPVFYDDTLRLFMIL